MAGLFAVSSSFAIQIPSIYDPVGNPLSQAIKDAAQFSGLLPRVFTRLELTSDFVSIVGTHAAVKRTMRGWAKSGKQGIAEGISCV